MTEADALRSAFRNRLPRRPPPTIWQRIKAVAAFVGMLFGTVLAGAAGIVAAVVIVAIPFAMLWLLFYVISAGISAGWNAF